MPSLKTYVINLARSSERRKHIIAELGKTALDYEIVEAVDARDLDVSDPSVVAPEFLHNPEFRPGSAGCALSHLKVYQAVIAAGLPSALVLEDDVVLPPDLAGLARMVSDEMSGPEVALLNFHYTGPVKLQKMGSVPIGAEHYLAAPVDLHALTSGGAYLITREACERIAEIASPIKTYCDDWEWMLTVGAIDRLRCVRPMPVRNSPVFQTTIDYYRPGSIRWRLHEAINLAPPRVQRLLAWRRSRDRRREWTGEEQFV